MNEERAFVAAILERPDDDVTKLVYADWLEEQSDPRGEYLRLMLQVRLVEVIPSPFPGKGIATDPKTGGLVGIDRGKRQVMFATFQAK